MARTLTNPPNLARRRMLRCLQALPLVAAVPHASATTATAAAVPGAPADVVTQHSIGSGAGALNYSATYNVTVLRDAAGKVQASVGSTAYVLQGPDAGPHRPVLFLYNGGPGSSSSMLQFGGLGPRRIVGTGDAAESLQLVDNAYHLLAGADLVFVDPVGTGFSQVPAGGDGHPYWNADGDAKAAVTALRGWLERHGRRASPLYLCGESYGGFRVAMMTRFAADLPLAGLVLVSPLLDLSGHSAAPGNDLPYILNLPTMSAAAWQHKRIARDGRDVADVFDEATRFAQGDYASALQLGRRLPAADAQRIAARMAALIGLPQQTILEARLRVPGETFMLTLLNQPGRRIGSLDTRVTGSSTRPLTPSLPTTDPSFPSYAQAPLVADYYRRELKVPVTRPYVTLTLEVNRAWNYRSTGADATGDDTFYIDGTRQLVTAMTAHPTLRLLVIGGYFDMSIPYLGSVYAVDHAGIDPARVRLAPLRSGHSPYGDEATLREFADCFRTFLQAGVA